MSHFTNAPQAATHRVRFRQQEPFFTDGLNVGARRWTLHGNLMDSTLSAEMVGSTELYVIADRPVLPAPKYVDPVGRKEAAKILQVGGNHYDDMPVDVFEFCEVNGLGFVESTAIKYIARRKSESRIEDLQKAISCIQRLIKHEETGSWER